MELCIMIQMLQNVLIKAFLERLAQQTVANSLSLTGRARPNNLRQALLYHQILIYSNSVSYGYYAYYDL